MTKKAIAIVFFLLTSAYASIAQNLNKPKLDSLFAALESHNKNMGSLALSVNGDIVYQKAIGSLYINGNDKTPSNPGTKYRIGSISKMFTACMIFQLVEEGKLSLSAPLSTWYPTLPNASKITIGNMLDHRSGLYNFTNDSAYRHYMAQPQTEAQMIARFEKQKPAFEPDTKAEYSNTNFYLLGHVVEKVTQKTYAENLAQRITSKLGLKNTYYGGKTNTRNNEAFSYAFDEAWVQVPETDMSIPGGAGAILSTPTDLVKFIEALFAGKLISKEHLAMMTTMKDHYGMAMFEIPFNDKKGYGHNGGIDGFTSILAYFPDDKLAIAYCANGGSFSTNQVGIDVLSIYFNKPLTIPDFKTIAVKTEDLDKYLGMYSSTQMPLKITVTKDKTTLVAQATGQPPVQLDALGSDKFSFESAGIILEFEPAKNQFTLKQAGQTFLFTKDK
jgi:CubicO group peptidase (beta-lactamase class C family)